MSFTKAERRRAKARILLTGPAGSGKSYSALLFARGLVGPEGRIAAIDTEHGSLSNYSEITDFDVMELGAPFKPERYIAAMADAMEGGYDALIIDSITHEWSGDGGILDLKDKSQARNEFAKWAAISPRHQRFIEAMLQLPLHVIATVRSKTEYVLEQDDKGRAVPKKVGQAPQQRDGVDYEFTVVFDLSQGSNLALASKDRTSLFAGQDAAVITKATGDKLRAWLESGAEPEPAPEPAPLITIVIPPEEDAAGTDEGGEGETNEAPETDTALPSTPEEWKTRIAAAWEQTDIPKGHLTALLKKRYGKDRIVTLTDSDRNDLVRYLESVAEARRPAVNVETEVLG